MDGTHCIPPFAHNIAAFVRSASSSTIAGHFPPSSMSTGLRCFAATLPMILPTAALPMNSIFRIRGFAMRCSVIPPAASLVACIWLSTPGGIPASTKADTMWWCVNGESSEAFSTTVQPAPMAEQSARVQSTTAAFQLKHKRRCGR